MLGYDVEKAVPFMLERLDAGEFPSLAPQAERLTRLAIEQDFAYMRHSGVLDDTGHAGDAYYDDDDAFEWILEGLTKALRIRGKDEDALARFVDQYLELQQRFMEESGLLGWE